MPKTNTTILIPDISGYTEFLTTTELRHSSHAINMFLDAIVEAVGAEYDVSEIEGDAVLFVRKGPAPSKKELLDICLKIFNAFHFRRLWMQQHTICPCNACLEIKHLTLKFVAHYGPLAEIKVGRIIKQSGPDMILAHRLLKNKIGVNEYLLITEKLWNQEPESSDPIELEWISSSEDYASLGKVEYRYALLDEARKKAPSPPEPEKYYRTDNTPFLEIPISANFKDVYMVLKNIPDWAGWMPGLQKVEQEIPEAFLGSIHYCAFEGYKTIVSPLKMSMSDESILYAENCRLEEMNISIVHEYVFKNVSENLCLFACRFLNAADTPIPGEINSRLLDNMRKMAEKLKEHCERIEGSFF